MSGGNVVPPLTTHVLDTARGIPGGGINMVLMMQTSNGEFREIERGYVVYIHVHYVYKKTAEMKLCFIDEATL